MRTTRRLLVFFGATVAVLVLAEGFARVLAPALPAVEVWGDQATAVKVAQMDSLGCADVVFVGNSVARDDLDPTIFAEAVPGSQTAYNAALDAASPTQLARWLPDEVVPRLDPSVVVWAITSPDLNDGAPAGRAAFRSYDSSIGGRDDLLGRLQRPLVDHVAIVRHREALADPATLWHALGDRLDGTRAERPTVEGIPGVVGSLGQGLSRRSLQYEPGDPVVNGFTQEQLLGGFHVGGAQLAAARALIGDLERKGIAVVLVLPPMTNEFVELHPNGDASFAEYRAAVQSLATATEASVVDLSSSGNASWFADTHHLNGTGTREVTAALASELAASHDLAGPSRCGGTAS